jgi:sugar lactone lactonase YvrE
MRIAVAVIGAVALAALGGSIAMRARRAPADISYAFVRQIGGSGPSVLEASHIAIDSHGFLYALDRSGLVVFKPGGTPITTLIACGQRREQLQSPMAFALDSHDRIYIADAAGTTGAYGNRIAIYSTSGSFLGACYGRTEGDTPRRMAAPLSIVCNPQGHIHAADAAGYLWTFGSNGQCLSGVPLPVPGSRSSGQAKTAAMTSDRLSAFPVPIALACDSQGSLFAASSYAGIGIVQISEGGHLVRSVSVEQAGTKAPVFSLVIDKNDHLFTADQSGRIAELTKRGSLIRTFRTASTPPGGASPAVGLTIDPLNQVWSADTGHDAIMQFTADGRRQLQFSMSRERNDAIGYPSGIALDPQGHVFITDKSASRISIFNADGGFIRSIAAKGGGPGELSDPRGIAVDKQGRVFVADSDSWNAWPRVSVFSRNGRFIREIGGDRLVLPVSVAVDDRNNVFVGDFGTDSIQQFKATGEFVQSIGHGGSGPGEFTAVAGVAVDSAGQIFAADSLKASRILVFRPDGKFLRAITAPGKLTSPDGIALDGKGHIFVSSDDPAKPGPVLIFTNKGKLVGSIGETGPGALSVPSGLAADHAGHIYAIDSGHGRVVQFAARSDD